MSQEQGIAIVGMAGRFPGAGNLESFWRNLREGVESVSFFRREEMLAAGVDPALLDAGGYVPAKAVLAEAETFDAAFFGLTPREAEWMDPQHRVFLECAWEALEDAGCDPSRFPGRVGLYAGSGPSSYLVSNLLPREGELARLGAIQALLLNDRDFLATRASYKLDLKGPSVVVQTACSTSLVAVHMACQSLLAGECDMALAGGVSISTPLRAGYVYQEGSIASPDGHTRSFDAAAGGAVEGNGCGVVVLRRLADALAEGDSIRAVILGSAVNNDGAGRVGFTAPAIEGQAEVISEALLMAGVEPDTLSYVEAHGSGTALGDPIEVEALTQAFRAAGAQGTGSCGLGSVKTNIGHCNTAAGVAGLLKTVLALQHRTLPPSLHFERPNPRIDFAGSPFYVCTQATPWEPGAAPRRAGVSSFGLGGTNAHAVLEEAPAPEPGDPPARAVDLLLLSARTPAALDAAAANLADRLEGSDLELADVAWTLQTGRRAFEHRRAVAASGTADAVAALRDAKRGISGRREDAGARPVVFLFPGLGDQYAGMARGLYESEGMFRETVDLCAERLAPRLGGDLREVLFAAAEGAPPGDGLRSLLRRDGHGASAASSLLHQTAWAQPACFAVEYALARQLMSWGIRPEAMIGYSIGEYVAACLAGALSLDGALALVAERARLIQALPAGSMLAVPLPEDEVRPLLAGIGEGGGSLGISATNGPHFCVVGGSGEAVAALERRLAERGASCLRLQTTHAFHTALMQPAAGAFLEIARAVAMRPPEIPYLSNVTGDWSRAEDLADPSYWVRHMTGTVRFAEGLGRLLEEPARVYLEVGPGATLCSLVKQHPAATAEAVTAATLRRAGEERGDLEVLVEAAGRLWIAGAEIDWPGFHGGARRRRVALPTYPFERRRCWVDPPPRGAGQAAGTPADEAALDLADWFWVPAWRQAPPVIADPAASHGEEGAWLLFLDGCGLGERIAARLRRDGRTVFTVVPGDAFAAAEDGDVVLDPARRQDYDALVQHLRNHGGLPARVLHLWGVTGSEPAFDAAQTAGLLSLMLLEQAVTGLGHGSPVRIALVANGLHEIVEGDPVHPAKATVVGAVKVVHLESARLTCGSIDVALPEHEEGLERLAEHLVMEMSVPPDRVMEPAVAYRGRQRWIKGYEPVRLPAGGESRLLEGGVYLVTDGVHGPGMAIARHLALGLGARVAVIVPPRMPAREDWEKAQEGQEEIGAAVRKLLEIEKAGALDRVLVVRAEPGEAAGIRAALEGARARFGPIHGAFHTAGAFTGGLIQLKTRESLLAALGPAARGAEALLDALAEEPRPPAFVLLSSSALALSGGLGQLDIAAAGCFLDALAVRRSREGGPFTVAVHWDPYQWDSWLAASAAGFGLTPDQLQQNLETYGISSAQSGEALRRLLAAPLPHVAVSARDLLGLIRSAESVTAESLLAQAGGPVGESQPRPGLATPFVPPRDELEESIALIWQALVGIAPIGADDSFLELGGHSLLAIQILTQVRTRLEVDLPVTALFEAPTVAELARAVRRARGEDDPQEMEKLLALVEGLSPEEALARMAEMGG